jgi:HD-GYP domain-containing protein (c-di-GMP phosphodiesterase class II)
VRRVPAANARVGMILRSTIYDVKGMPVLTQGETLTEEKLPLLARSCSAEILVEDSRTEDIVVGTLFAADLEAKASQALNILMVMNQGVTSGIQKGGLMGLVPPMNKLVSCLYPTLMGEADISGTYSLQGYQYIHPVKVAELAMVLGRLAGAEKLELLTLGIAAALMNIGYMSLRPGLLEQPRPLEKDEWELVKKHPQLSIEMLKSSGLQKDAIEAIAQHHERWDGKGYPNGLKGHEISLYARILGIADTYISLRSRRPYRKALRPHEAIEFIIAYSGELFDPELVKIFARQIPQYPAGITVVLSSGEGGVVSAPNPGHVARPVVRVLTINGVPVREPFDLDLSAPDHQKKIIVEVDV